MPTQDVKSDTIARHATLQMSRAGDMPVLAAKVPADLSRDEFSRVAFNAYDVISKLTGHPCMSGRIKFVVEDIYMNEAMRVDLRTGQIG